MPLKKCRYHLVLVTKYRYKILDADSAEYIVECLNKWSEKLGIQIIECSVEPEHLHLAFEYNGPAVEKLIGKIKGQLSFSLHKKFRNLRRYTIWTDGYYLGTLGEVSTETVQRYIANQGLKETETVERVFKLKVLRSRRKSAVMDRFLEGVRNKDKSLVPAAMLQRTEGLPEDSFRLRADLTTFAKSQNKKSDYAIKVGGGRKCGVKSFWLALKALRELPQDFSVRDSYVRKTSEGWFVHLVTREERIVNRFNPKNVISIDLGIKHPVTSVAYKDGKIKNVSFWGKELKNQIWKREKRRSQLQAASKKYDWEMNPLCTLKYQRRIEDMLHKYTKSIVDLAKQTSSSIAIGNLLGIRAKSKRRWTKSANKANFNLHKMPFGKLKAMLEYKAKLAGVPLVFVNEAFTSQLCSKCGYTHPDNRDGRSFECRSCDHKTHADMNGAVNIAAKACQLSGYDTAPLRTTVGNPRGSQRNPLL